MLFRSVEGREDAQRVKNALDCECLITHGYGFNEKFLNDLEKLNELRGIIIFTDPDYAGNNIRRKIKERIPNAKHAYLPRDKSIKGGDIGVENANSEDIIKAIEKARPEFIEYEEIYTMDDLINYGLTGPNSKKKRIYVCDELFIGYSNSKRLLTKLNTFQVDREEIEDILYRYEEN